VLSCLRRLRDRAGEWRPTAAAKLLAWLVRKVTGWTGNGQWCPTLGTETAAGPILTLTLGAPHQACPLSQKCFRLKLYPYAYAIGAVHVEHIDGCPAHGRETDDAPGLDPEVLVPGIGTGVEEGCQLTGCRIYTREIRPLVAMTEMTGEGEVRLVVTPVMLLRHDVLDVTCDAIVLLMDTTLLAAVARTVAHARLGLGIHLRRRWLNDESAGLLLKHGNHVHRLNVGVVLCHFLGRYGALVTLFGKLLDARLYSRISA
jgi:hypothetical protein